MLIVVGLLIAFVLVAIYANPKTRACRWRAERRNNAPGRTAYRCAACGARAFTSTGKPPLDCRKDKPEP